MEPSFDEQHILSSEETARVLGISETSVRNWVRHGFIETLKNDDLLFREEDVITLLGRIQSGELNRLNSRANKSGSSRTFLHPELLVNDKVKNTVAEISSFIMRHNIPCSAAMFFIMLNILTKSGIVEKKIIQSLIQSSEIKSCSSKFLCDIILKWRKDLPRIFRPEWSGILEFDIPEYNNITGVIYQSVLMEGDKSRLGLYYTPEPVVREIIERVVVPGLFFLDPCCGTGDFLLAAAAKAGDPLNIYGIDIDPIAVNLAKMNLMLRFPDIEFNPNIYCADFLLDIPDAGIADFPEFDCIATNPPWGSHYKKNYLEKLDSLYPEIISGESFSFFLLNSFRMLREGGMLSFILPESLLNVKKHRDIRNYLLENLSITRIQQKKRIFKNVFTNTIVIDMVKTRRNASVEIVNKNRRMRIGQGRFRKNRDFIFDINVSSEDKRILSKIFSCPYRTLKGHALWALGIVTGNNSMYITKIRDKNNEPVITGKDISPFKIAVPASYIVYEPEKFQQTARIDFYRNSCKLVYKYISRRLIFACDTEGRFTLNSANILIPCLEGVDIKVIMGLFNSTLYQYIFQKKFSSLKVLKNHLETMPIPVLGKSSMKTIIKLVEDIEDGGSMELLDKYIFGIFGLDNAEIEYVKAGVR